MRFGFAPLNHAEGQRPDELARSLEERGFDSVWVPEHSHIPVDRATEYVAGGELPQGYYRMMDPFVSLMAMASSTSKLLLATGVCQVLEHDLIDLAKTVATLDVLSEGRVLLGVGAGWNVEELANHRADIPFSKRYEAIRERLDALRRLWSEETPSFEGTWDRFTPSWVYPKPIRRRVPIALGMSGPIGLGMSARLSDHWIPIDAFLRDENGKPDVGLWVTRFRQLVEDAGRDPQQIPISMFYSGPAKARRLEACRAAGIDRVVCLPGSMDVDDASITEQRLDELAPFLQEFGADV